VSATAFATWLTIGIVVWAAFVKAVVVFFEQRQRRLDERNKPYVTRLRRHMTGWPR
jgi:hypothetical protein